VYTGLMAKGIEVNGERLRQERERRAWTQEELSEKSGLGIRTLRRMEAGSASKDSLRRVTQALALEPEVFLDSPVKRSDCNDLLRFELISIEVAPDLIPMMDSLHERVSSIRRHIAFELGILTPGVRFRDNLHLSQGEYVIKVRELPAGSGTVHMGKHLAVGPAEELALLDGEETLDPTYGMNAKWIPEKSERCEIMYFDPTSVVATHLTHTIRTQAHRLLGIEDVHKMLDGLDMPHLVSAVVPEPVSLAKLRAVLRELLREEVSIRDLGLILETLADVAQTERSVAELVAPVRVALSQLLCQERANKDKVIKAIVVRAPDSSTEVGPDLWQDVHQAVKELQERGHLATLVVPKQWRQALRYPGSWTLSTEELHPDFVVDPIKSFDV
jgi:flagellar biosynthesis protein FlhA